MMSAKVIADGLLTLFIKRYAGPFWIRRKWLQKTQWLSRDELETIQLSLLQRLIHHCYNTVPYYRRLMDSRNIKADNIRTLEDIKKFPILTKKDVLEAGSSIISTKYPKWLLRKVGTSGTTGTPMPIYRNLFSIGNEHAFVRRQWDWAGIDFHDKCAYLKGRVIAEPDRKSKQLYVYDPIMKELHLSTYHLSVETAKDYIEAMKKYNVKAIYGFPSSVYPVAKTCLDYGLDLKLKSALLTAETLPESHKETIAKAFGCKVVDFYGAAERVCYIHTCEQGSYHIIPEYGLTELIPIDGPTNERCKIIATGFWNTAMPLMRYDTGDVFMKSEASCSCGRAFPVIQSISGREGDAIRTPSGELLGASIVTHLVYVICGADYFLESQVIQDDLDHIVIEYVPTERCSSQFLGEFKKRLAKNLPSNLKFDLRKVDAVQRTSSGKIKPIVSQIESSN
jgi:phenylacetate-CoA ligase